MKYAETFVLQFSDDISTVSQRTPTTRSCQGHIAGQSDHLQKFLPCTLTPSGKCLRPESVPAAAATPTVFRRI